MIRHSVNNLLLISLALFVFTGHASASTIYVNAQASGNNNGLSWTDAYVDLQDGLSAAAEGDEIWVAAGTYIPSQTGDRNATFQLVNGVKLYGGFQGTEMIFQERDFASNVTILSGDLLNDDHSGGDNSENSNHVVTSSATDFATILDGFHIVGGNSDNEGGGILNISGSPNISNCFIYNNSAYSYGGGMYNSGGSNPTLTNTIFSNNTAEFYGGAVHNIQNSNPIFTNCKFTGNVALNPIQGIYSQGGAIWNHGSNPILVNSIFSGNSADNGGAIHSEFGSTPHITNCSFYGNIAHRGSGGGVLLTLTATATINNSNFWGNTPDQVASFNQTQPPSINFCNIEGGYFGNSNIDSDPVFVDADGLDDILGTVDDDLRLAAGSPSIDAADNALVPLDTLDLDADGDTNELLSLDLDNTPRFKEDPSTVDMGSGVSPIIDIGAYEFGSDRSEFPDIIVTNLGSGSFSTVLNVDGTIFDASLPQVGVGNVPNSIDTGDFNEDGNDDIVIGSAGSGKLTFFLGDGAGGFPTTTDLTLGYEPGGVVVGDFNNDGHEDVFVGAWNNTRGNFVQVLLRQTDPFEPDTLMFSAQPSVIIGQGSAAQDVIDLDGDGNLDALANNWSVDTVTVLSGDGQGNLTPLHVLAAGDRPQSVQAGLINDDDKPDIIFSHGLSGYNRVYFNIYDPSNPPDIFVPFIFADQFTLDGQPVGLVRTGNIISSTPNDEILTLGLVNGTLHLVVYSWQDHPLIPFVQAGTPVPLDSYTDSISLADFNNDGYLDVVVSHRALNKIVIYYGDGTGNLSFKNEIPIGNQPFVTAVGNFASQAPDTIPPVISVPANIFVEATGPSGAMVEFIVMGEDDVDGVLEVNCDYTSGDSFPILPLSPGTNQTETVVTCSAEDSSGNSAQETFSVIVQDTTAPEITTPIDEVLQPTELLFDGVEALIFTVDNLKDPSHYDEFVRKRKDELRDLVTYTIAALNNMYNGDSYQARYGMAAFIHRIEQKFTVERGWLTSEQILPLVNIANGLIADIDAYAVEATGPDGANANYAASAYDIVDGMVGVSCVPASGSLFPLGVTSVNCTAVDSAGNLAAEDFYVLVKDTTPPMIDQLPDQIVEASGPSGAAINFTATATDIVDGSIVPICTPTSGSTFYFGASIVTCNATDVAGNTAPPMSFSVTVLDTTAPVVNPIADITVEATGPGGAQVDYSVTATDAVDGTLTADCFPISGVTFPLGASPVTCTATDTAGNISAQTVGLTVIVQDTTPPVINPVADIVAEATGPDGAQASYSVTASDLVDGAVEPYCFPFTDITFPLGISPVSCSATDSAGNVTQQVGFFSVTVQDTTAPTLTVPDDIIVEATGPVGTVVEYVVTATDIADPTVTAVCSPVSGTVFPVPLSTPPTGTTTVSCTATDSDGNQAGPEDFLISIQDTTPPDTVIESVIDGAANNITAGGGTLSNAATFQFSGTDVVGISGFECKFDSEAGFSACTNPQELQELSLGNHTMEIRAVDTSGNADPTPATFTWRILTPQEAILSLIDYIQSLVDGGSITEDEAKNMIKELHNAIKEFNDGKTGQGLNKLSKVPEEAGDLLAEGILTQDQFDRINEEALLLFNHFDSVNVAAGSEVQMIKDEVTALELAGTLIPKDAEKLVKYLDEAVGNLSEGKGDKALEDLEDFKAQVQKFYEKGTLGLTERDFLLVKADHVINALIVPVVISFEKFDVGDIVSGQNVFDGIQFAAAEGNVTVQANDDFAGFTGNLAARTDPIAKDIGALQVALITFWEPDVQYYDFNYHVDTTSSATEASVYFDNVIYKRGTPSYVCGENPLQVFFGVSIFNPSGPYLIIEPTEAGGCTAP